MPPPIKRKAIPPASPGRITRSTHLNQGGTQAAAARKVQPDTGAIAAAAGIPVTETQAANTTTSAAKTTTSAATATSAGETATSADKTATPAAAGSPAIPDVRKLVAVAQQDNNNVEDTDIFDDIIHSLDNDHNNNNNIDSDSNDHTMGTFLSKMCDEQLSCRCRMSATCHPDTQMSAFCWPQQTTCRRHNFRMSVR